MFIKMSKLEEHQVGKNNMVEECGFKIAEFNHRRHGYNIE
jgi:hypothetical protein